MTEASTGDIDGLLIVSEVAELFGVCTSTVRNWVKAGRLEVIRTPGGRDMRFTQEALKRARNRGLDGDTNAGGDAAPGPPDRGPAQPDGAPPTDRGGCGFPLPDSYRSTVGWCLCGARLSAH